MGAGADKIPTPLAVCVDLSPDLLVLERQHLDDRA